MADSRGHNRHQRRFGPWLYKPDALVLVYQPYGYSIDLRGITTSAQMLDWIFQIYPKDWGPGAIVDLIEAFYTLFNPQSSLCGFGSEQGPIDPAEVIRRTRP